MQLLACRHALVELVLVQPPCLGHQPPDPVPVYRMAKLLLGYRKTRLHRRFTIDGAGYELINQSYRKNRKRFPGKEKRMNMLLALEPLIYFEGITNGS